MKKLFALVLAVLMVMACFAGCGSKGVTLEDVKKAGKLVIATSPDFPPFEELQADGSVTGIEIDIMELVCAELGVELVIKQMSFDSVLPGVQSGKYDVGVSGISVTPKRQKNVLFTDPYCLAAQVIVVKTDSTITKKADLAGKKVSVQLGTTAEDFCRENGYEVDSYESNPEAKLALTTDKVDAWVVDDLTAAEMCKDDPTVKILSEHMTTEPYAFAFNFEDEALVDEINAVLATLIADGTVAELFAKYNAPYTQP